MLYLGLYLYLSLYLILNLTLELAGQVRTFEPEP